MFLTKCCGADYCNFPNLAARPSVLLLPALLLALVSYCVAERSGQKAHLFFSARLYLTSEPILNQFVQEKTFYYQS